MEVRRTTRGPLIYVSRTHKNFLRRLFELEVPEIHAGTVEIKAIAREAGSRSKIAVSSRQEGLDPVGATVGQRGGRVQSVVAELGGEKIDVIPWSDDPRRLRRQRPVPAQVVGVEIDEENRIAAVTVPERMLSLAIGREGQNARLAAKLTGLAHRHPLGARAAGRGRRASADAPVAKEPEPVAADANVVAAEGEPVVADPEPVDQAGMSRRDARRWRRRRHCRPRAAHPGPDLRRVPGAPGQDRAGADRAPPWRARRRRPDGRLAGRGAYLCADGTCWHRLSSDGPPTGPARAAPRRAQERLEQGTLLASQTVASSMMLGGHHGS